MQLKKKAYDLSCLVFLFWAQRATVLYKHLHSLKIDMVSGVMPLYFVRKSSYDGKQKLLL